MIKMCWHIPERAGLDPEFGEAILILGFEPSRKTAVLRSTPLLTRTRFALGKVLGRSPMRRGTSTENA